MSISYIICESDAAQLHETIDLFKFQPVVVVRDCGGIGERAFWGGTGISGMAEAGEVSVLL